DVVVLTSGQQLDEHREWVPAGARIHDSSAWVRPEDNLAVQTALVARARRLLLPRADAGRPDARALHAGRVPARPPRRPPGRVPRCRVRAGRAVIVATEDLAGLAGTV